MCSVSSCVLADAWPDAQSATSEAKTMRKTRRPKAHDSVPLDRAHLAGAPGRAILARSRPGRGAMSDPLEFESRDTPFPVALAGMIGIAIASSVDDSFGVGALVFGIVYLIASIMLLRGSRLGYYLTIALSVIGLVGAVVYMFSSSGTVFGGALLIALTNALVLYLLVGRDSPREFFGLGARARG